MRLLLARLLDSMGRKLFDPTKAKPLRSIGDPLPFDPAKLDPKRKYHILPLGPDDDQVMCIEVEP